jgi:hypothetical protein
LNAPTAITAILTILLVTLLEESGVSHSGVTACERSLAFQPIGSSKTARVDRD